ncbi:MAG: hypothetical protein MJE68_10835 [Proteobacteria bacterium]|nr:hypothetical protein [Pseudomonadota bacterium]
MSSSSLAGQPVSASFADLRQLASFANLRRCLASFADLRRCLLSFADLRRCLATLCWFFAKLRRCTALNNAVLFSIAPRIKDMIGHWIPDRRSIASPRARVMLATLCVGVARARALALIVCARRKNAHARARELPPVLRYYSAARR